MNSSCHAPTREPAEPPVAAPRSTVYPLQRDAGEHARLKAQAAFWQADAQALFESAGVAAGWQVADLGCGTLDVAQLLARRVGPTGRVRALDNDVRLLALNLEEARRAGLPALRVEAGDAFATGWPAASLDALHARFLAAPTGRLGELLHEARRLLRPGGLLMQQEPDARSWHIEGGGLTWLRVRELIRQGFARRGGEFDVGARLQPALQAAGFEHAQARRVVHALPAGHPYAQLPLAFARQLRPLWLEQGLVTAPELDALLSDLNSLLARAPGSSTFTLVQAWARRS